MARPRGGVTWEGEALRLGEGELRSTARPVFLLEPVQPPPDFRAKPAETPGVEEAVASRTLHPGTGRPAVPRLNAGPADQ